MRILIGFCLVLAAGIPFGSAEAATIQLGHDEELTVIFAIPGYNPSNPGALFPTTIGLELAGYTPAGSAKGAISGSTAQYYTGVLLEGLLQSTDGANSLPLFDADAWRLGLPTGDLVADASWSGGFTVYADAVVSLNASQLLFGSSGQAEFVIKNVGGAVTIGLGDGYSISNAILAPLSANNGGVQTAGYLVSAQTSPMARTEVAAVPEPAAFGVAAGGGVLLFWLGRRTRKLQR